MKNDNIKLKTSFKFLLFVFTFSLLLFNLASVAQAVDVPGWPIVPCGTSTTAPCTKCDLFRLLKNIIDFTIGGLMPPIAVLLFVWGGFLILLGGANLGWYTQGQTIFKNTFYGIIIMLSAWMITNTLIQGLGADLKTGSQPWWQFTCVETPSARPPNIQPPASDGEGGGGTAGGVCSFAGMNENTNLCQPRQMACSAPSCSSYVSVINQYAGGAASANLLKAIMVKESNCNPLADSGHAYGIMQFRPSTAVIYASRCGVQNPRQTITSQWLKNNPALSVCMAAEYIRALSQSACGNTVRNIAAGYNGGEGVQGACGASVSCASETSCDGGPKKRWECWYNNPQQNSCNIGYNETRDYATKVLYCYNNPGF